MTCLHQQRADGGIERAAQDALARRITEEFPPPEAHVVGDGRAAAAAVVMHVHAAAAHAADRVSLQQRRPFARRAPAALEGDRAGGGEQLLLVALVLLPRHVGRVGVADQHVPLLLRQAFVPHPPVGPLAPAAPAIGVGASVPRIVQRNRSAAQGQRPPRHLACARPSRHAGGKEQALLPEKLDRGMERPGAGEGGKEQPHALLHLRVGVEDHPPGAVIHQTHRQPAAQLAAAGFAENAAAQARPQDVQLRLAHRPLEPEQQAIVEMRGIVHAVFVENQGVGHRADLEQAVPVGGVACQARDLQPQHDPGAAQPDLGHQALEALAVHCRGPRLAEIRVDDDHLLRGPPQRHGALAQPVLALRALGVLEDLPHRRLPHVEVRVALEVSGRDLLLRFGAHRFLSFPADLARLASTCTRLACWSSAASGARTARWGAVAGADAAAPVMRHASQPARPWRSSTISPQGPPGAAPPAYRCRRSCS